MRDVQRQTPKYPHARVHIMLVGRGRGSHFCRDVACGGHTLGLSLLSPPFPIFPLSGDHAHMDIFIVFSSMKDLKFFLFFFNSKKLKLF